MDKLKILVACHKPWKVCQDEVYTPIHVGRAVSKYKDEMTDMIGDDTGDNISEKNPQYCELTAQYWAWKNLHDVEYIGFCHYRRFFGTQIDKNNIDALLKNKDMLVIEQIDKFTIFSSMTIFISIEDITILMMVLKKKYPEYEKVFLDYLYGCTLYSKNMFVCKKDLFDDYAAWLFDILFECEKYIRLSPYSRQRRSLAYLGEYLLPVYLMHHHFRLENVGCVDFVGKRLHRNLRTRVALQIRKWHGVIEKIYQKPPQSIDECIGEWEWVRVGFENDGIRIE